MLRRNGPEKTSIILKTKPPLVNDTHASQRIGLAKLHAHMQLAKATIRDNNTRNKSSAVAEMGDRLATIDMDRKLG